MHIPYTLLNAFHMLMTGRICLIIIGDYFLYSTFYHNLIITVLDIKWWTDDNVFHRCFIHDFLCSRSQTEEDISVLGFVWIPNVTVTCIQGMRLYCFRGRFEKAYQSNIFKQLGSSSERFVGVLLIQGLPYHPSLLPISEMDCAEASNSCQRICGMKIFTSKSWLMQNTSAISSGVIAISSWTKNIFVFFKKWNHMVLSSQPQTA